MIFKLSLAGTQYWTKTSKRQKYPTDISARWKCSQNTAFQQVEIVPDIGQISHRQKCNKNFTFPLAGTLLWGENTIKILHSRKWRLCNYFGPRHPHHLHSRPSCSAAQWSIITIGTFGETNVELKCCTYDVDLTWFENTNLTSTSMWCQCDIIITVFMFYVQVTRGLYYVSLWPQTVLICLH